jgi:hypothetical protein
VPDGRSSRDEGGLGAPDVVNGLGIDRDLSMSDQLGGSAMWLSPNNQ